MKRSQSSHLSRALGLTLVIAFLHGGCTEPVTEPILRRGPEHRAHVHANYTKAEYMVPMRDGVRLHTAVYTPRDTKGRFPILMLRTPYSCRPYGEGMRNSLGPSALLAQDGYIFVYQDVRGCYMSEGQFVNMRPHLDGKRGPEDVDESTDTYDTIEWLMTHLEHHNGRVGMWGISYPGFYAAAGMIDAHPALKAVSPQAPIADWYFDDFHHHGAFFLPHAFGFLSSFGKPRPEPTASRGWTRFDYGTPDGYQFYLEMGSVKNANDRYLEGKIPFWNDIVAHPDYDGFWQARNILPHLHNVAPAVMTVGGWYDAEDLYGPLNIYRSVEENNPESHNVLVMGPWVHGGWARNDGAQLGDVHFGAETSLYYREHIERPFFNHHLKGQPAKPLPEATVFETGSNRWRQFDRWPPVETKRASLFLRAGGELSFDGPMAGEPPFDEFISDPAKPVPFTEKITTRMVKDYMVADQRFAGRRPDVLVYQSEVLTDDVTLVGSIGAELWCQTTAGDADWVVKLIDVYPNDAPDSRATQRKMGGYQQMVRSEVIRGRYRNGYDKPEPFQPGYPAKVTVPLQDVLHTFKAGHRIMVQIHSTWFPMVDRNPQKWVDNIFLAEDSDFTKASHRVLHDPAHASRLIVTVLEP